MNLCQSLIFDTLFQKFRNISLYILRIENSMPETNLISNCPTQKQNYVFISWIVCHKRLLEIYFEVSMNWPLKADLSNLARPWTWIFYELWKIDQRLSRSLDWPLDHPRNFPTKNLAISITKDISISMETLKQIFYHKKAKMVLK